MEWAATHDLGAIQHNIYLAWAQEKLVVVGSRNSGTDKKTARVFFDIHALDVRSGEPKWFATQNQGTEIGGDHGKQDLHPAIVGDRLYCEPYAYELHTGKPLEDWGWVKEKRRGCGTISASSGSLFFRQSNPTLFDLKSGRYETIAACTLHPAGLLDQQDSRRRAPPHPGGDLRLHLRLRRPDIACLPACRPGRRKGGEFLNVDPLLGWNSLSRHGFTEALLGHSTSELSLEIPCYSG